MPIDDMMNDAVITLKCTIQVYLASGLLMPLPSQSHAEQILKKSLKTSNPRPVLLLHRLLGIRGLTHYSPRVPNKAKNQESFRRDTRLFVS
jgi:hypothetical protein